MFRTSTLVVIAIAATQASAQQAPANPFLADSTWPLFHRNNYAQAAGYLPALQPGDAIGFQRLENPKGGTSPWTVVGPPYTDGSQAAFGSVQKGVVKWLLQGERFEQISYVPLPRGRFDFDWYVTVLASGEIVTTNIKENALYVLRDERPDCPRCELVVDRKIEVPQSVGKLTIHFSVSYDGHIIILLEDNKIAAISPLTGDVVATGRLGSAGAGYSYHNAFAIDENNRLYISSQQGVIALDWTGAQFATAWEAAYDFRGPGCKEPRRPSRFRERLRAIRGKNCTGTGTTASLIGTPESGVVVMVDGHAPNNSLVAFWRGAIPRNWDGLPGEDRRLAGRIALPLSTPDGEGYTAENSPAVLGHSVFIAQWAGFNPDCSPPKGVQRVDWLESERRFALVWANPSVHFNGIPTASSATGLVYGTGRGDGCTYAYRGLDIDSGELRLDVPLNDDKAFTDQGNQQTIAADGSIIVGVRKGQLRLYRQR
ncbi:MAG: hypothetical protein AAGC71_13710 [Pseudomonadota bacterium]